MSTFLKMECFVVYIHPAFYWIQTWPRVACIVQTLTQLHHCDGDDIHPAFYWIQTWPRVACIIQTLTPLHHCDGACFHPPRLLQFYWIQHIWPRVACIMQTLTPLHHCDGVLRYNKMLVQIDDYNYLRRHLNCDQEIFLHFFLYHIVFYRFCIRVYS